MATVPVKHFIVLIYIVFYLNIDFSDVKKMFNTAAVLRLSQVRSLWPLLVLFDFYFKFLVYNLEFSMTSIFTELAYIFVQLKDASGCGSFSLHWRPIADRLLLSVLWSGCCLFDTFPISILNFIWEKTHYSNDSTKQIFLICRKGHMCKDMSNIFIGGPN